MKSILVTSFGFKHGSPAEGFTIDCRNLPNPYGDKSLRVLTGKDQAVRDFVMSWDRSSKLLKIAFDAVQHGHQTQLNFGCFGGKHRSVVLADEAASRLKDAGYDVTVKHCQLEW